jgi:actin-related protein 5
MTITSVQTILPGRYAVNATEKRAEKPPPKTYGVQEFPFKGYQPPQPDGFEQSRSHPDTSVIVIDNGKSAVAVPSDMILTVLLV